MAHILVIDDDVLLRDVVTQMLEKDNHYVEAACDGDEGLRMFRKNTPDIVITDIIMPGTEGLEIIKEMVRLVDDLPIVAMSGGGRHSSYTNNLKIAKALGARAMLPKPFTRTELFEAITVAMG